MGDCFRFDRRSTCPGILFHLFSPALSDSFNTEEKRDEGLEENIQEIQQDVPKPLVERREICRRERIYRVAPNV